VLHYFVIKGTYFIKIIVSHHSETDSSTSGLGILIFIAILLHHAPAAIGFGTFLHHEGLRDWGLSKHLLVIFINLLIKFKLGIYFELPINCNHQLLRILDLGKSNRLNLVNVLGRNLATYLCWFFPLCGYYSYLT